VLLPVDWINAAILSAAVVGVVNIVDSHLLSKRMPSLRAFLIPVAAIYFIYGSVLFVLFPLPEGIGMLPVSVALASGVCRAVAIMLMLHTLMIEEVSRVIPVVHTFPVFVAILAIPILAETLDYLHWIAIVIVVAGVVAIAIRQDSTGSRIRLGKWFCLCMAASFLFAIANIASKYALEYISFWSMYSLSAFCMAFLFLSVSVRPSVLQELRDLKQRGSVMALLAFNETLALVGILLSFWAMSRGPISLVSTILGTRPLFVFIYAVILSRCYPVILEWRLSRETMVLRLISIVMIVAGIAIIYLS